MNPGPATLRRTTGLRAVVRDQVQGAANTLRVGLICLGASALFALKLPLLRESVRLIYVTMGKVPAVASGIQTASESTVPPEN